MEKIPEKKSSSIKKPETEKEKHIGERPIGWIDWVKGAFWGGPSQSSEVDKDLPDTHLEERELEEGEREEGVGGLQQKESEKPGFFKTMFSAVGNLFGEGEVKVKKEGDELNEEQKNLQEKMLNTIKDREGLLGQYLEENAYNIVSNTDEFLTEKIVRQEGQELNKLSPFEDAVIGGREEKYNLILDVLEQEIQAGTFPDFEQAEFNKELFKKDPLLFMLKALSDNKEKTDLCFIINYLAEKDPEFKEAFVKIKHETQDYFFELRKAKRDPKDHDYQKAMGVYDQIIALEEAIHECDVEDYEVLEAEFQESFGEELEKIEAVLIEKEKQEFQQIFQELAHTLLVDDKDYQKARVVIDNRVYQAGSTLNVAQLYFSDAEFREAYNVVNAKFKGIEGLLDIGWQEDRSESLMSVGELVQGLAGDTGQFVADNKGKMLLSPALIIGTVVFGVQVIPIAAGLSIVKQALPVMKKMLVESDLLFDTTAAREDQKIRMPFMQHIFLESSTGEQRKRALDTLLNSNVLFIEDLEADPELKDYFSKSNEDLIAQGKGPKELPSFSDYREKRMQFRMLMQEDFPSEVILKDLVAELKDSGLIYQEDFKGWSDEEISKVLPEGIKKEALPTVKEAKDIRNASLFLLKGGVKLTVEQKLGEVAKLHQKGVLFKEDIARLKADKVATDEEITDFLKANKISLENLPSIQTHYYKTNVSLKQQEDRKREPFLEILKSSTQSQADKLLVLKKMHLEGVCFLDDLELEGLEEATVSDFKQFVSLSSADRKKMHDEAKTGEAIISKCEAVLKSDASADEKMASLLELEMEGLLSKEQKKMVDQPTLIRYNALFLGKAGAMSNKLENAHEHYQSGVYTRLVKLGAMVGAGIKQNPGKIAGGLAFGVGGGWMAIGAAAFAGDIAGVIWRKEHAVEIFNGPMKEVKNGIELGVGVMAGVVSDFTDIPAKKIHERIVKHLPSDRAIKQGAAQMLNKSIGTITTATLGASIGSLFGIMGMKIGAAIGGFYGAMVTDGKVSQIPAGGFLRAFKFSGVGALIGAVVPVVLAAVTIGLALAGLISMTAGIAVSTGGLGLIIPLILFGAYAGFQIAGLTGQDVVEKTDPVIDELSTYEPFSLEKAGVYLV